MDLPARVPRAPHEQDARIARRALEVAAQRRHLRGIHVPSPAPRRRVRFLRACFRGVSRPFLGRLRAGRDAAPAHEDKSAGREQGDLPGRVEHFDQGHAGGVEDGLPEDGGIVPENGARDLAHQAVADEEVLPLVGVESRHDDRRQLAFRRLRQHFRRGLALERHQNPSSSEVTTVVAKSRAILSIATISRSKEPTTVLFTSYWPRKMK